MRRIVTILAVLSLPSSLAAGEPTPLRPAAEDEAETTSAPEPESSEEPEKGNDDVDFGGPYLGNQASPVEAEEGADYSLGVFTFGLWQRDANTISSKFLEYRDIPQGAVAPFFRLQGKKEEYRYDLVGNDVTQDDQRYMGRFEGASWKAELDYVGVPHGFGNGGRSILIPVAAVDGTQWRLSDTLQESFQSSVETAPARGYEDLLAIVQPTLDTQPATVDIELQRNITNVSFSLLPGGEDRNFDVGVTYLHERRTGNRTNNGTSFGFFNVVETADPIRYITQDFGVNASMKGNWGIAFAGLRLNEFSNRYDTFIWDNPFRASDSTDPQAYLGPTLSVNGPKQGRLALPPSNEAWTANAGTTLKLGSRTRLSGDLQFGQWRQNEQSFIPYTINSAIVTPSGALATEAALPAARLDGRIDVLAVNGYLTSRVTNDFRLNARYRFYENDNQTPRLRFEEGYVRFDAVWEEIPRISVPYGFDSNYLDVYGTYDVGRLLGLEVGYKWNRIARTFRETEHTAENTVRAAADLRFGGGVLVRGLYELGTRDFDAYDAIEGEEASFLAPEGPANQTVLRRYDQARRDRSRVGTQVQWTPDSGMVTISAGYFLNRDDYDDSPVPCDAATPSDQPFCPGGSQTPLGLQRAEYETFSLDVDLSPSDRYTLYAFYSREDLFDFQTGRQSGGTLEFDPASNWSSTVDDTIDTFGAGTNLTLVPEKWFLDVFYRYQNVDGNNAFTAGSALSSASSPVEDILAYDDTKIHFVSAQIRRRFAESWTLGLGGFWEDYVLVDTQTGSVLNYMPGSFFINANDGDYRAWVGWMNLAYSFSL